MERERLSPEEIEALFSADEDDAGGEDGELDGPGGLPPDLFARLERLGARTFLAAFEDLDDFLEVSLGMGAAVVSASRGPALVQAATRGAHALLVLRGESAGRVYLVLGEASLRVFLARALAAPGERVEDELGPLHEAALEGPVEEFRACLARHLEDDDLEVELGGEAPALGAPEVRDGELRLVRLDCPVELDDATIEISFFMEEELARSLAAHERARAAEEEAERLESEEEATAPSGLVAWLGRAGGEVGPEGLEPGCVIRLDRLAGEWVELRRGEVLVAEGQVVVEDDHYAVRIERRFLEDAGGGGA